MAVPLHGLALELLTDAPPIRRAWKLLFDSETERHQHLATGEVLVQVHARLADELPPLPSGPPHFVDPVQGVTVFTIEGGFLIYLGSEHRAEIHLEGAGGYLQTVSRSGTVEHGRFEDLITMALAPILRRRGIYMIHAFAAARPREAEALLLVGNSGSGKTTTGLALRRAGWQMLANDVAFLEQCTDVVWALPSPGTVHVTSQTIKLLPELQAHRIPAAPQPGYKLPLSRAGLVAQTGQTQRAPLTAIYFPQVSSGNETSVTPLPRAQGLARLLTASMDQWDKSTWSAHLTLLTALAEQVRFCELTLGRDLNGVTAAINADMRAQT